MLGSQGSGKGLDESALARRSFAKVPHVKFDEDLGFYLENFVAAVTDLECRLRSSSGGITTWLLVELLRRQEIDGVLHVKRVLRDRPNAPLFQYAVSTTEAEIRDGAKSKYYPAAVSSLSPRSLAGKRFAITAIPSVASDLRRLAAVDAKWGETFPFIIGLICGHQKSARYLDSLAWQAGVNPLAVTDFDFRVKRTHGPAWDYSMRVEHGTGAGKSVVEFGQADVFGADWGHGFFKARFSDFTDDALNETADIAVGDAWMEPYASDSRGTNVLIVRNEKLLKILRDGARSGEVTLSTVGVDEVKRSQRGLLNHARTEIGYRVTRAQKNGELVPTPRVETLRKSFGARWVVQWTRERMAQKSHFAYRDAWQQDDWMLFERQLRPWVRLYELTYKFMRGRAKLRKTFAAISVDRS
jgi:coenzyme F420-reducing hydrogenase beta subunit